MLPTIQGVIARRILANYRIDPAVMEQLLPPPFRPKLINGWAIGGICLIRLEGMRPAGLRFAPPLSSENAAHRFAVEWDAAGQHHEAVFVPRRDTDSRLAVLAGGTLFPGVYHRGHFRRSQANGRIAVRLASADGQVQVEVVARHAEQMPADSVFDSIRAASDFFQNGAVGYSTAKRPGCFDAMELCCTNWHMEPLAVEHVSSSFFADEALFPRGSTAFDCALLMQNIRHQWHARQPLKPSAEMPK